MRPPKTERLPNMKIPKIPETVAKSRTIQGLPCIIIERTTPNASGRPSESVTLAVFKDDEVGNALADELFDAINKNKVRM